MIDAGSGISDGFATMGGETRWRIQPGLVGPRARAAFAGLGAAAALLALVIVPTALKFTVNDYPLNPTMTNIASFAREAATLAAAIVLPLPLLVAASNLAPARGWRRYAWLLLSTGACALVGVALPVAPLFTGVAIPANANRQLAILIVLLAIVLEFRQRALATAGALLRVEIDGINADARLRDASLRVLQAQVAPHFLFNTLANVRRLAQLDRKAAAAMLGDLVEYFSVTLARRDAPRATLRDEVRLVDAYLRIHRVRMGSRLAYEIDVPDSLASVSVPSMILLTLVENAIKHGVNPLAEGGFVRLRAERRGADLHLEVADNGRGLARAEGHGTGLANVRARLSILYGARAALETGPGQPRGFVANVSLPLLEGTAP